MPKRATQTLLYLAGAVQLFMSSCSLSYWHSWVNQSAGQKGDMAVHRARVACIPSRLQPREDKNPNPPCSFQQEKKSLLVAYDSYRNPNKQKAGSGPAATLYFKQISK